MTILRMLWLPGVLRAAGLRVSEISGWQSRGHDNDGDFTPRAAMLHHDGSGIGDSPAALDWLLSGFNSSSDTNYDAQLWVDRAGVWHIIAAGRAQHAGIGLGWGAIPANAGNQFSLGVETDHTDGESWPPAQLAAVRAGMAAICTARGWDPATAVVGHKEYAPGRKSDPAGVDMRAFRGQVAQTMNGVDDVSYDDAVRALRDVLRLPATGLKVPQGQLDNSNLAAMLVSLAQAEVGRERVAAEQIADLVARGVMLAAQGAALQVTVDQLGSGVVDMEQVRAAAQAGAEAAIARLRLTTDAPPTP